MVGVAQLVRASGCGPEGREFESLQSPQTRCSVVRLTHLLWEQGIGGSNPSTSTNKRGYDMIGSLIVMFLFMVVFGLAGGVLIGKALWTPPGK